MSKTCFKCHEAKPLDEYYRHKGMADGHLGKCKACAKADNIANRLDKVEQYRDYDVKRYKDDSGRRSMVGATTKEWIRSNPEKRAAHTAVGNAVRDGRLVKPSQCEECGDEAKLHGHHHDYSRKLDVLWVCVPCHSAQHS
jgi:hypothetical protein